MSFFGPLSVDIFDPIFILKHMRIIAAILALCSFLQPYKHPHLKHKFKVQDIFQQNMQAYW